MPAMDGTNSMPAGMMVARSWASWPAPLGMAIDFPSANCRRLFDGALKSFFHQGRLAGADASHLDPTSAGSGNFSGELLKEHLEARDNFRIVVSDLEQHFGAAWNNAGSAGIERDAPGGPNGSRARACRKAIVDRDAQLRGSNACILPVLHPRGAGVILLAGHGDPILPDADDRGDNPDAETGALEGPPLFDMGLEISDVPAALHQLSRAAGKAGCLQCLAHGAAFGAVARAVDIFFGDVADIGAAAEEMAEVTFLVAPRGDFHRAIDVRITIDHARRFKRIDHTKRTIEPAGEILALQMRAREQLRSCFAADPEHVADAVDLGVETGFRQFPGQPV